MNSIKRIALTPGEPAGIGPDLVVQIAQRPWAAELIVIADPDLLSTRAQQLQLPLELIDCHLDQAPTAHLPGQIKIYPMPLTAPAQAGRLDPVNANYVLSTLTTATKLAQSGSVSAIVTGPVHKGIINQAGIHFTGHTEFFAEQTNTAHTVMFFVAQKLKVALATTHIPLATVSQAITKPQLSTVLTILRSELRSRFGISEPRILVCGLNPHAGEGGYLGREEIEVITPLLDDLRAQGWLIKGPLPADTIFTPQYLEQADAIVGMYHDQVLPTIKFASFGHAVNVTLGLPFIRTSVDHGTALDLAGTGQADTGSMVAALQLAIDLATH